MADFPARKPRVVAYVQPEPCFRNFIPPHQHNAPALK
jgi:hypothetical protein